MSAPSPARFLTPVLGQYAGGVPAVPSPSRNPERDDDGESGHRLTGAEIESDDLALQSISNGSAPVAAGPGLAGVVRGGGAPRVFGFVAEDPPRLVDRKQRFVL